MLNIFLIQLAAGCMAMAAVCRGREVAWQYLRLMAAVTAGLLLLAAMLVLRSAGPRTFLDGAGGNLYVAVAMVAALAWLVVNAIEGPRAGASQRIIPLLGALIAMVAAARLSRQIDPNLARASFSSSVVVVPMALAAISLALGSLLLGAVTATMLLGHRYLTDTDMTIAPLRRLSRLFIAIVLVRTLWVSAMLAPAWNRLGQAQPDGTWLVLMLTIRVGIGLLGTAAFAYMAWDCVRRRSTQSATGILYLAMVFAFIGELSGQYLMRAANLAL